MEAFDERYLRLLYITLRRPINVEAHCNPQLYVYENATLSRKLFNFSVEAVLVEKT